MIHLDFQPTNPPWLTKTPLSSWGRQSWSKSWSSWAFQGLFFGRMGPQQFLKQKIPTFFLERNWWEKLGCTRLGLRPKMVTFSVLQFVLTVGGCQIYTQKETYTNDLAPRTLQNKTRSRELSNKKGSYVENSNINPSPKNEHTTDLHNSYVDMTGLAHQIRMTTLT